MRRTGFALLFAIFAVPVHAQTLEQQEQLNKVQEFRETIGKLREAVKSESRLRRMQCIMAIADERLCVCLDKNLPPFMDFVGYVGVVTKTKDELKYNSLSDDNKFFVDNIRKAREICVKLESR